MNKITLLFIVLSFSFAQQKWIRTYGGTYADEGYAVQPTSDSGYICAGFTSSFGAGQSDLYIIKTRDSGDTLWTRTFGGAGSDYGYSILQTQDNGYIIAGQTYSYGSGSGDVYSIKTDAAGSTVWARTYGGTNDDVGGSVQKTSAGGYIIAGFTSSFGAGSYDVYLINTDSAGDTLWTKAYGGTDFDYSHSVRQVQDNGYIAVGGTSSFGAGQCDIYLIRTDAMGETLWTKTYGGAADDRANSVQLTADSGFIIAGVTSSFGAGQGDVWLVKTNAAGDTLWTRTYGGTNDDWGNSVQHTSDGGYIIAGWSSSFGSGGFDIYLIRTDAGGDTLWTKTYGGAADERGNSVQQTPDGGYIVAGLTYSFGSGTPTYPNVYLIKTDANGNAIVEESKSSIRDPGIGLYAVPNPFITYTGIPGYEKADFFVLDITGRTAGKYKGERIGKNLPAGVYFIVPYDKSLKPVRIIKIK